MTAWAERRRDAALEKDNERLEAERFTCPECEAAPGETCRNVHDGQPLGKLPAHWRRIKAALDMARGPVTPEQAAWDALWQPLHDRCRARGLSPNAAIRRANDLMDLHGYGPRPVPKETQQ